MEWIAAYRLSLWSLQSFHLNGSSMRLSIRLFILSDLTSLWLTRDQKERRDRDRIHRDIHHLDSSVDLNGSFFLPPTLSSSLRTTAHPWYNSHWADELHVAADIRILLRRRRRKKISFCTSRTSLDSLALVYFAAASKAITRVPIPPFFSSILRPQIRRYLPHTSLWIHSESERRHECSSPLDSLQSVVPPWNSHSNSSIKSPSTSRFVVFLTAPSRLAVVSLNRNLLVRWSFAVQFAPQRFSLPLIGYIQQKHPHYLGWSLLVCFSTSVSIPCL